MNLILASSIVFAFLSLIPHDARSCRYIYIGMFVLLYAVSRVIYEFLASIYIPLSSVPIRYDLILLRPLDYYMILISMSKIIIWYFSRYKDKALVHMQLLSYFTLLAIVVAYEFMKRKI